MATAKQIAANRLNAQKNTGPRTAQSKATSRFNALKHGIYAVQTLMFDEKPEDLAELSAEYHEHHSPANSHESLLVETLVHNEWRLRRMRRVEAGLWQSAHDLFIVKNIDTTLSCTSGDAFATDSATFERLQRVVNTCERTYHRALKELKVARGHALRTQHSETGLEAEPLAPQPQHSTAISAKLVSFRQNPQTPAPAGAKPPVVCPDIHPDAHPDVHPDAPQSPLCDSASLRRRRRRFAPLTIANKV